jgi:hypothetical protein
MGGKGSGGKIKDLTGKKFGRLLIIKRAKDYVYSDNKKRLVWECLCDCGKVTNVLSCGIVSGNTKSCGCLASETRSAKWQGCGEISMVYWSRLKDDAKKRNLSWNLSIEEVWNLYLQQDKRCSLTRVPIKFARNIKKNAKQQTASLDRIDSSKHYTISNIHWVHKNINKIKWDWKLEELYYWCELLLKNKRLDLLEGEK